jgi:transcription elongation GreA/GreB family factor
MSRAFVKELDGAEGEALPELAISPHRNLVTAEGLAQIDDQLGRLEDELAAARAADDRPAIARVERDLRYWRQRRGSAEVVPKVDRPDTVRFGCSVQLEATDGTTARFRLVGEDQSDPAHGLISWVSPLAEALLGAHVGDDVPFRGGRAEIVGIDP